MALQSLLTTGEVKTEFRSPSASEDNIHYILQKELITDKNVFSCWLYFQDHQQGSMLESWHSIFIPVDEKGSSSSGTFSVSTWPQTWPRCTSHMWRDLGMQFLPFSGVLPAGLDSVLFLGNLLRLLEGLLASNYGNVGNGSLTSGLTAISRRDRSSAS